MNPALPKTQLYSKYIVRPKAITFKGSLARPNLSLGNARIRKGGVKVIPGGITAARGFLASGIHCGIKYKNKDLALIYSQVPCVARGVFTQNQVKAASLKVTQQHLKQAKAQAIVINSGNANCCTGRQGIIDAQKTCQEVAKKLEIKPDEVLMASTGIIGKRLPLEKIKKGIPSLIEKLSREGSWQAAQAIMTTDTHPKQIAVEVKVGKTKVKIGAIAKGAGMISPHLATMLAFITTDAAIDKSSLGKALKEAVDNSFNLITVEGDTSTNDMVLILANGLAANLKLSNQDLQLFQQALNFVCLSLAKEIIQDAEGSTKFVQIQVEQAKDLPQAKRVAFKIANSPLVKTAIFGENPNWGRIAAAAGIADQDVREDKLSIWLGGIKVFQNGTAVKINSPRLKQIFKKNQIQIKIGLGLGSAYIRVLTCDLSHQYIKINAEY